MPHLVRVTQIGGFPSADGMPHATARAAGDGGGLRAARPPEFERMPAAVRGGAGSGALQRRHRLARSGSGGGACCTRAVYKHERSSRPRQR
jgi:hypothetical protein